jgi:hypothetical protein
LLRNCLVEYVFERKIEDRIVVTGRRGKEVSSYWMNLKKHEDIGN